MTHTSIVSPICTRRFQLAAAALTWLFASTGCSLSWTVGAEEPEAPVPSQQPARAQLQPSREQPPPAHVQQQPERAADPALASMQADLGGSSSGFEGEMEIGR